MRLNLSILSCTACVMTTCKPCNDVPDVRKEKILHIQSKKSWHTLASSLNSAEKMRKHTASTPDNSEQSIYFRLLHWPVGVVLVHPIRSSVIWSVHNFPQWCRFSCAGTNWSKLYDSHMMIHSQYWRLLWFTMKRARWHGVYSTTQLI